MQLSDAITHATAAHIVLVMLESKVIKVAIPVGMISSICVLVSYGEDVDFVGKVPNCIQ